MLQMQGPEVINNYLSLCISRSLAVVKWEGGLPGRNVPSHVRHRLGRRRWQQRAAAAAAEALAYLSFSTYQQQHFRENAGEGQAAAASPTRLTQAHAIPQETRVRGQWASSFVLLEYEIRIQD